MIAQDNAIKLLIEQMEVTTSVPIDLAGLSLSQPLQLKPKEEEKQLPISERDETLKALVNFKDLSSKHKQQTSEKEQLKSAPIYIERKEDSSQKPFDFTF